MNCKLNTVEKVGSVFLILFVTCRFKCSQVEVAPLTTFITRIIVFNAKQRTSERETKEKLLKMHNLFATFRKYKLCTFP